MKDKKKELRTTMEAAGAREYKVSMGSGMFRSPAPPPPPPPPPGWGYHLAFSVDKKSQLTFGLVY